jgi:nucleotide-binding universal stress UspA family protein
LLVRDVPASALAALHYAAPLARLTHASLQVLHVVDTRVSALPRWTDVFRSTEAFAELETANQTMTQQLLRHPAVSGLTVTQETLSGHPADRIVDAATRVDLVVMGIQRLAGVSNQLARQVVHGCPVPVLLVPTMGETTELPPLTDTPSLSIQHMLLALHIAQYAPQAVVLSQTLAAMCNAALDVLQVFDPDHVRAYPFALDAGLSHNIEGIRGLTRTYLEKIVPDGSAGPLIERLVLDGQPAEVILKQAATRQADLIVMSVHAYGGLQKLFSLSTVDAVLEQLPCPLLAVPLPRTQLR